MDALANSESMEQRNFVGRNRLFEEANKLTPVN